MKKNILIGSVFSAILLSGALTFGNMQLFKKFLPENWLKNIEKKFNEYHLVLPGERVYVQTDKALYKPGETVWFQAYLRNDTDLKPSETSEILTVEWINPKGAIETTYQIICENGASGGEIDLDANCVGGMYKLKVYSQFQKNDPNPYFFEKDIQVQQVVLPRLKMKLDFEKKAYGPNDEVIANVEFKSLSDKPLTQTVNWVLKIQGNVVKSGSGSTDAEGKIAVKAALPSSLTSNDGTLTVSTVHEGQNESITRTVPIMLNTLSLAFYPEGGDLVAGLKTSLAFQALNEFKKPADISGAIYDAQDNIIQTFESYHFGMGACEFTPKSGQKYYAKITKPSGINGKFEIPDVREQGFSLRALQMNNQSVTLEVGATLSENLGIIGQMRGKVVFIKSINVTKGTQQVLVPTANLPAGVIQFTLFDKDKIERAERLVFVNKNKKMSLKVKSNKETYQPREKVELNIEALDDRGLPVPGIFSLSVVDDKLLSMHDDRQANILASLLLEKDLNCKIEEPNFYFDSKEPKSDKALEYLMMTAGWRRFTWEQMLKGKPAITFPAKKALLAGKVFNATTLKPVKNTDVKINTNGQNYTVKTDTNGYFEFKSPQINGWANISVSQNGLSGSISVGDFGTDYKIMVYEPSKYSSTKNYAPRANKNVDFANRPEEAMGGGGFEVMEGAVLNEEIMDIPAVAELPKAQMADADVKDVMIAPAAEKEIQKMDVAGDIDDDKEEFFAAKKKMRAENRPIYRGPQVVYHRVREFPAVVYASTETDIRTDFRSTIFWKGNINLDSKGKTKISFYANDAITSFRATIEGVSATGLVGHEESVFVTQKPFSMDVKVPVEVSMGDVVKVPLALKNTTNQPVSGNIELTLPKGWTLIAGQNLDVNIPAQSAKTLFLSFQIANMAVEDKLTVAFKSAIASDKFEQVVKTVSKGFPSHIVVNGADKEKEFTFTINHPVDGTVTADFQAFPSPLSEMMQGLDGMLSQPGGCFEQTSSTNYPNAMIMQYMQEYDYKNEEVKKRAASLLDFGYKRLVSFETKQNGYEWFGSNPPHEALTAYGILEFKDMQKVYAGVDNTMVKRTSDWLLSRRDGKGGFLRDPKALDSFGRASEEITNAYIVYSLSEAGTLDLKKEVEATVEKAKASKDPYMMALACNILYNYKDNRADAMLKDLLTMQEKDGSFKGKTHSVTYSQGQGLIVETTALTMLATLKSTKPDAVVLMNAAKYIASARNSWGGYGSTQSTVLGLKALTNYAKFSRKTQESGTIELSIDGKIVAESAFKAGDSEPMVMKNLEKHLKPNTSHKVKIAFKGCQNAMPYTFKVNYSTNLPNSAKECKVDLKVNTPTAPVKMGETLRLTTTLTNTTKEGLPMTIALVGIPAGFNPQPYQLKELQEKNIVDFYEIKGRYVAFYYRALAPNVVKTIALDLKADIPGTYEAPASCAYLYYTNEHKIWTSSPNQTITE